VEVWLRRDAATPWPASTRPPADPWPRQIRSNQAGPLRAAGWVLCSPTEMAARTKITSHA